MTGDGLGWGLPEMGFGSGRRKTRNEIELGRREGSLALGQRNKGRTLTLTLSLPTMKSSSWTTW
jgi:hypothetical protein